MGQMPARIWLNPCRKSDQSAFLNPKKPQISIVKVDELSFANSTAPGQRDPGVRRVGNPDISARKLRFAGDTFGPYIFRHDGSEVEIAVAR
jgi:hypothetical protein